jgi:hypothetical protein
VEKPEKDFTLPKERDEPFGFRLDDSDTTEVVGQSFLNYSDASDPTRSLLSRDGHGSRISLLLFLIALVGTGVWWQNNQMNERFGSADNKNYQAAPDWPFSAPTKTGPKAIDPIPPPELEPSDATPASKLPPAKPTDEPANNVVSLPDTSKRSESPTAVPQHKPAIASPDSAQKKVPAAAKQQRLESQPPAPIESADIRRKRLETEVAKAIENRAIAGVAVAVIDEIIYLDGRVATERQRNAAEQAARSVAGVEKVRNRIGVNLS